MTLTLYYHPLSSYCWKALVALYEAELPFAAQQVDLGNASERDALCQLWPPGRFPVLRDGARTVAESSILIEYLAQHHPSARALVPTEPDAALRVRAADRMFDLDIHIQMQKIVGDRLRPADQRDEFGVATARRILRTGYAMCEQLLAGARGPWACGETFTVADCSAAPALWYGDRAEPMSDAFPSTAAYLARLVARPSFARALREAEPYFAMFPKEG